MQRWIFQCLFTAVYSTYSCLQLWIYACSKACNVNQSQFNQSRHYCHRGFPSSLAQRLFGSRTFANLDIKEIRWEKKARVTTGLLYGSVTNKVLYHYPPLSHHVAVPSQQHFLRGDLHDHTCESIKAQTHFFLSPYRWLFNLCTLLLFTGFHIYPHTSVPRPQAPPPRWFRSCPFLSSFYPKASVGDRIILRVVINCISYFLLFHLRCASCAVCWAPFLWDSERRQQLARETRALMMNKSRKH